MSRESRRERLCSRVEVGGGCFPVQRALATASAGLGAYWHAPVGKRRSAACALTSSEEAQVRGCALMHAGYAHDGLIIQMVGWMRAHDIPIRGRAVQGELHEGDPELQAALRASLVQTPPESAAEEMDSSVDAQISSDAVFAMQLHELDEQDGGRRPRKSRRKAVNGAGGDSGSSSDSKAGGRRQPSIADDVHSVDMDRYANAAWIMIMLAASAEISEICRTVQCSCA
jgi:hypothetical protein